MREIGLPQDRAGVSSPADRVVKGHHLWLLEAALSGDLALTLGRQERDNLEFKSAVSDRDKICKAICALANDLPGRGEGYLLIGVADDGAPIGLAVTDELLLAVRNYRNDGRLLPRPTFHVERGQYDGSACVLVTIPAAISPPVSFDGRVFVRVGPSTQVATPDEERRLRERRRAADLPFEQQPVPETSLAELDLELFSSTYLPAAVSPEVIAENQRTLQDQLASLRLLTPDAVVPTVLGHLLIGFDPTAWIPGAYVQFVRYEGVDVDSAVQDHEELRGNLVGMLDALNRLLPTNIRTAVTNIGGLRQVDTPDYPLPALRELVLNALMHRAYDITNAPTRINWFADRVEITSPGGPFGAVTAQNFDRRNDYRNPALAAALKQLGYVNRFGRGIELVRAVLAANGNQPAEFMIEPSYWSVQVRAIR